MKQKLFSKDFTLVVIGQIISLFGNAFIPAEPDRLVRSVRDGYGLCLYPGHSAVAGGRDDRRPG